MTMTEETKLIKTDSLGRVTLPKEQREAMLDAFEASAMSGAEFARNHGVPVMTFASWIQKRRRARGDYEYAEKRKELPMSAGRKSDKQEPGSPMNLIEIAVTPSLAEDEESGLEVVLGNGVKVRVTSESQVSLLKVLIRELSC